jgi:hypothetical protein
MTGPGLTVGNLNKLFKVLSDEVAYAPANLLTRKALQREAGGSYDPRLTLSCLMKYEGDELIKCSREGVDFKPIDMNKDYEEFHLTSKGAITTSPYANSVNGGIIVSLPQK